MGVKVELSDGKFTPEAYDHSNLVPNGTFSLGGDLLSRQWWLLLVLFTFYASAAVLAEGQLMRPTLAL